MEKFMGEDTYFIYKYKCSGCGREVDVRVLSTGSPMLICSNAFCDGKYESTGVYEEHNKMEKLNGIR